MVDTDRNLLMVRGPVPGSRNTMVMVRYAHGAPIADRVLAEEIVQNDEPVEILEAVEEETPEAAVTDEPSEEKEAN